MHRHRGHTIPSINLADRHNAPAKPLSHLDQVVGLHGTLCEADTMMTGLQHLTQRACRCCVRAQALGGLQTPRTVWEHRATHTSQGDLEVRWHNSWTPMKMECPSALAAWYALSKYCPTGGNQTSEAKHGEDVLHVCEVHSIDTNAPSTSSSPCWCGMPSSALSSCPRSVPQGPTCKGTTAARTVGGRTIKTSMRFA
jgi:hypothetical protein